MEFFYDQAPDVMRSCCMALNLLSTALGGYVSAALLAFVTRYTTWLKGAGRPPDVVETRVPPAGARARDLLSHALTLPPPSDLDSGSRLDLYFLMLAGIMLANTVAFAFVASRYKYKVVKHRAGLPRIGTALHSELPPGEGWRGEGLGPEGRGGSAARISAPEPRSGRTMPPCEPLRPHCRPLIHHPQPLEPFRLDPTGPGTSQSQAISISRGLQGAGYGYQWHGTPQSATPDAFGRSVTYFPTTPALPGNYS